MMNCVIKIIVIDCYQAHLTIVYVCDRFISEATCNT